MAPTPGQSAAAAAEAAAAAGAGYETAHAPEPAPDDIEVSPMILLAQAAMEMGGPRPTFSDYAGMVPSTNPWGAAADGPPTSSLKVSASRSEAVVADEVQETASFLRAPGSPTMNPTTAPTEELAPMRLVLSGDDVEEKNGLVAIDALPQAVIVTFEWGTQTLVHSAGDCKESRPVYRASQDIGAWEGLTLSFVEGGSWELGSDAGGCLYRLRRDSFLGCRTWAPASGGSCQLTIADRGSAAAAISELLVDDDVRFEPAPSRGRRGGLP